MNRAVQRLVREPRDPRGMCRRIGRILDPDDEDSTVPVIVIQHEASRIRGGIIDIEPGDGCVHLQRGLEKGFATCEVAIVDEEEPLSIQGNPEGGVRGRAMGSGVGW